MLRSTKILGTLALALVFGLAMNARAEETSGTVKAVDATKAQIVLKGLISDTTYNVNKDAAITLDGVKSMLADLKEGDHVTLTYRNNGGQMAATDIRGLRIAHEATGTVRSAFADRNEIVLKGLLSDTTYNLDKGATVWLNGKESTLAAAREGDQALVTYRQNGARPTAIRVSLTRK